MVVGGGGGYTYDVFYGAVGCSLNLLWVRLIEKKLKFKMLIQPVLLNFAEIKFKKPHYV